MTPTQYLEASSLTASGSFHGELIDRKQYDLMAAQAKRALSLLDTVKKSLFYGRTPIVRDGSWMAEVFLPRTWEGIENKNAFHAVLGMATEAGELLDIDLGDKKRVADEAGDVLWYLAMLLRETGLTFEDVMQRNIDKLMARFPDKFIEAQAIHRDEVKENQVFASIV